jgi:WXG100 family type VII secretion target
MSGDYTMVQFNALEDGRADFASVYSAVEARISSLNAQLRTHLSQWTGSAQAAYHEAEAAWNAAMLDMQNVLNSLGGVISTANQNYTEAESTNTRMWGN